MGTKTIFDEIREGCSQVAHHAQHVHIATERISDYIAPLLAKVLAVPTLDTTSHFVGEVEDTIAFFTTLAAVNFGSGYFPHLRKRTGLSGYYTIATALTERFRSQGPFTAEQLADISYLSRRLRSVVPTRPIRSSHRRTDGPVLPSVESPRRRLDSALRWLLLELHRGN